MAVLNFFPPNTKDEICLHVYQNRTKIIRALLKQKADVLGWNWLRIGVRKTVTLSICWILNAHVKALDYNICSLDCRLLVFSGIC